MATGYILHNPQAGNQEQATNAQQFLEGPVKVLEISKISDYRTFLTGLEPDDYLVICGGDGTLNRFANDTDGIDFPGQILYYPNGTGNDFAKELGHAKGDAPFPVKQHLQNLPTVTVKGKSYRFLNGVGYGIDGYCCEVGDELKRQGKQDINYTGIAIKGLLFGYKPTGATITVDGVKHTYKKVWIAPTMHGKYYGGGMIATPDQQRGSGSLSTMIFHDSGKLRTLMVFPSIFKGEHIKHTKMVTVFTGKEITVEFTGPRALQIDGETILGVTSYTARATVPAPVL